MTTASGDHSRLLDTLGSWSITMVILQARGFLKARGLLQARGHLTARDALPAHDTIAARDTLAARGTRTARSTRTARDTIAARGTLAARGTRTARDTIAARGTLAARGTRTARDTLAARGDLATRCPLVACDTRIARGTLATSCLHYTRSFNCGGSDIVSPFTNYSRLRQNCQLRFTLPQLLKSLELHCLLRPFASSVARNHFHSSSRALHRGYFARSPNCSVRSQVVSLPHPSPCDHLFYSSNRVMIIPLIPLMDYSCSSRFRFPDKLGSSAVPSPLRFSLESSINSSLFSSTPVSVSRQSSVYVNFADILAIHTSDSVHVSSTPCIFSGSMCFPGSAYGLFDIFSCSLAVKRYEQLANCPTSRLTHSLLGFPLHFIRARARGWFTHCSPALLNHKPLGATAASTALWSPIVVRNRALSPRVRQLLTRPVSSTVGCSPHVIYHASRPRRIDVSSSLADWLPITTFFNHSRHLMTNYDIWYLRPSHHGDFPRFLTTSHSNSWLLTIVCHCSPQPTVSDLVTWLSSSCRHYTPFVTPPVLHCSPSVSPRSWQCSPSLTDNSPILLAPPDNSTPHRLTRDRFGCTHRHLVRTHSGCSPHRLAPGHFSCLDSFSLLLSHGHFAVPSQAHSQGRLSSSPLLLCHGQFGSALPPRVLGLCDPVPRSCYFLLHSSTSELIGFSFHNSASQPTTRHRSSPLDIAALRSSSLLTARVHTALFDLAAHYSASQLAARCRCSLLGFGSSLLGVASHRSAAHCSSSHLTPRIPRSLLASATHCSAPHRSDPQLTARPCGSLLAIATRYSPSRLSNRHRSSLLGITIHCSARSGLHLASRAQQLYYRIACLASSPSLFGLTAFSTPKLRLHVSSVVALTLVYSTASPRDRSRESVVMLHRLWPLTCWSLLRLMTTSATHHFGPCTTSGLGPTGFGLFRLQEIVSIPSCHVRVSTFSAPRPVDSLQLRVHASSLPLDHLICFVSVRHHSSLAVTAYYSLAPQLACHSDSLLSITACSASSQLATTHDDSWTLAPTHRHSRRLVTSIAGHHSRIVTTHRSWTLLVVFFTASSSNALWPPRISTRVHLTAQLVSVSQLYSWSSHSSSRVLPTAPLVIISQLNSWQSDNSARGHFGCSPRHSTRGHFGYSPRRSTRGHFGCSPRRSARGHSGYSPRRLTRGHFGCSPRRSSTRAHFGCSPRRSSTRAHFGCSPRRSSTRDHFGCSPRRLPRGHFGCSPICITHDRFCCSPYRSSPDYISRLSRRLHLTRLQLTHNTCAVSVRLRHLHGIASLTQSTLHRFAYAACTTSVRTRHLYSTVLLHTRLAHLLSAYLTIRHLGAFACWIAHQYMSQLTPRVHSSLVIFTVHLTVPSSASRFTSQSAHQFRGSHHSLLIDLAVHIAVRSSVLPFTRRLYSPLINLATRSSALPLSSRLASQLARQLHGSLHSLFNFVAATSCSLAFTFGSQFAFTVDSLLAFFDTQLTTRVHFRITARVRSRISTHVRFQIAARVRSRHPAHCSTLQLTARSISQLTPVRAPHVLGFRSLASPARHPDAHLA